MTSTDIFKIVQILIREYKCIVIPNLGAFILNKENKDKLTPPICKLSFNGQLTHDDGILATYLHKIEQISYDKALTEIQTIVQEIKLDLINNSVICGNLGTLSLEKDVIVYQSTPLFAIPSNYGLVPIKLNTIAEIESQKIKQIVSNKKFRFKQNLLAASVGAAVVLLFLFPSNLIEDKTSNAVEHADFLANISPIYNSPSKQNKQQYFLIVDSDPSETNAKKKLKDLRTNFGFEKARILNSQYMRRIYLQRFSSKSEAQEYLATLKINNPRFSNAWILTK